MGMNNRYRRSVLSAVRAAYPDAAVDIDATTAGHPKLHLLFKSGRSVTITMSGSPSQDDTAATNVVLQNVRRALARETPSR